jgi:hypothetical protein
LKDPNAVATERYVVGWFVFALAISAVVCSIYDYDAPVRPLIYILALLTCLVAALRILEITARATIVNFTNVISRPRSLILVSINYLELMLWFGLV